MEPRPIIHIIDDDEAVLKSVGRLLIAAGHEVLCHESAEVFLRSHDINVPGCAIVDLGLPGMDGFGVQESLAEFAVARPVIFLTGAADIPMSVKAMKAGAVDFLTKPVGAAELFAAVDQALLKDTAARQRSREDDALTTSLARLTPREAEVLDRVVAGQLNKQIAADLGTAEKTVKVHRGRMMKKLGVRTVADLIRIVTLHRR